MTGDYHERTRIAGFRETGSFVGYLAAAFIPLLYLQVFLGKAAPTFEEIVQTIGVFFVVALPVFVLWRFSAVPAVKVAEGESPPSWGELFAILKRNKPFARLVVAYFIDRLAMGTYFFVQPLLVVFALGMAEHLLWIGTANTVAAVLFAPLWVPVTRRFGKHRAYCYANFVTMLSYLMLFFATPNDLWLVVLANAVMGLGNGGTMITPPAMAADAVDHDELQSGVQMGGHMAFIGIRVQGRHGLRSADRRGLPGLFRLRAVGAGARRAVDLRHPLLCVVPADRAAADPRVHDVELSDRLRRHAEIRRMLEARRTA